MKEHWSFIGWHQHSATCEWRPLLHIAGSFPLNWGWVLLGVLVFITVSAVGIAVVTAILVRLPPTYFCESRSRGFWMQAHPVIRWTGVILKNIIGAALVALGIVLAMPGVPGPGLLTILLGIMMMDFPGKRRFEGWLIRRPWIFAAVNRLRRRYGKPPFILEDPVA